MIDDHNLKITEPEYRELDYPSYSLLASVSKQGVDVLNGVKGSFFQLKFGSLVDDMCFEPSKLVNYYHGANNKPPTGHPKTIADAILDTIHGEVGSEQVVDSFIQTRTRKISDNIADYKTEILAAAANAKAYTKYTPEKIMEVMTKDVVSDYFKDKLNSRGKMHIKPEMWANALEAASTLKSHDFTRMYFEAEEGVELFYQYKFIQNINGTDVKGMFDCVVADHNNKVIYPVDLKTGEAPVTMFNEVILLHKYYLQASLYREGMLKIVANDPDLAGYQVAPFEFVYLSKMNLLKPLIWVAPESLHQAGLNGFTDRFGFKHKGIYELLDLYKTCKNGMFGGYTPEVHENEGRIMLDDLIQEAND